MDTRTKVGGVVDTRRAQRYFSKLVASAGNPLVQDASVVVHDDGSVTVTLDHCYTGDEAAVVDGAFGRHAKLVLDALRGPRRPVREVVIAAMAIWLIGHALGLFTWGLGSWIVPVAVAVYAGLLAVGFAYLKSLRQSVIDALREPHRFVNQEIEQIRTDLDRLLAEAANSRLHHVNAWMGEDGKATVHIDHSYVGTEAEIVEGVLERHVELMSEGKSTSIAWIDRLADLPWRRYVISTLRDPSQYVCESCGLDVEDCGCA